MVAGTALAADAWATALTVLGPDAGLALAQARRLAARWVLREADVVRVQATDAFLQRLVP